MEDTSGFYKIGNEQLLFAPNKVTNKDYVLEIAKKDTYTYPVSGWSWFASLSDAETFFISGGWVKPVEPVQ